MGIWFFRYTCWVSVDDWIIIIWISLGRSWIWLVRVQCWLFCVGNFSNGCWRRLSHVFIQILICWNIVRYYNTIQYEPFMEWLHFVWIVMSVIQHLYIFNYIVTCSVNQHFEITQKTVYLHLCFLLSIIYIFFIWCYAPYWLFWYVFAFINRCTIYKGRVIFNYFEYSKKRYSYVLLNTSKVVSVLNKFSHVYNKWRGK